MTVRLPRHGHGPSTDASPLSMQTSPTLTLSFIDDPPRQELRDAGALRGWLVTQTSPPQIVTDGGKTWDLAVYRQRFSWYAVAVEPNTERADVAYYPHWTAGGTIAFDDQRYGLRQNHLKGTWRLCDENRRRIAGIRMTRPRRAEDKLRLPCLEIDLHAQARTQPDLWLLLVAAWGILTEPVVSPSGGGA